jgi:hypothetical protein
VPEGALEAAVIQSPSEIVHVELSPNGRQMMIATGAGDVLARDRLTGAAVARVPGRPPLALIDGGKGLLVTAPGEVWTYTLPPREARRAAAGAAEGSAEELTREVEWLTGQARDESGRLVPLSLAEWRKRAR